MRLTEPIPLELANTQTDAYGIAVLQQSGISTTQLAQLRWGSISTQDSVAYLAQNGANEIRRKLSGPRVGELPTCSRRSEEQHEHLVIQDQDLPAVKDLGDALKCLNGSAGSDDTYEKHLGDGRIISHAEWDYWPADWVEKRKVEHADQKKTPSPKGTNVALIKMFNEKIDAMWERHMAGKEHYGK